MLGRGVEAAKVFNVVEKTEPKVDMEDPIGASNQKLSDQINHKVGK